MFKLVTKIDTGILFFERIPAKITEFLPLYGKGRKSADTVLSVLPYKTISLLLDSYSGFCVYNLITFVGEPVVVYYYLL